MYTYLDACFPAQGWGTLARRYLSIAAAVTQQVALADPALFGGISGIALTLGLASQGGKLYQKTLARLHVGLCQQVLARSWRRSESDGGVASSDFDVISGAAGILTYLVSIEQPDAIIQEAIAHLLAYLLWLSEPGQPQGAEHWYIPPTLLPNEQYRERFPQGNFNCGLAHGIPGPMAALSLAWLVGYRSTGLRESIACLADWVVAHHIEQESGIDWPDSVPQQAATQDRWKSLPPARSAWCYGAPGVSYSLWLAGCALQDTHVCRVGVAAIESALRRSVAQRGIPSPNLCHGIAGLLQICLRFAHESESTLVRQEIPQLVKQLLEAFNPDFPLGFRDHNQEGLCDQPAWLTGAPGVAMTLLAASTDVTPTWDRVLALS